jgi:hypothetical protein
MNRSQSYRAARRNGCRRNRVSKQSGGAGEAYTLGGHVAGEPIINNYGQEIVRFPSCESAVRPGYLPDYPLKGGLPGFGSQLGGKRTRKAHGRKSKQYKKRTLKGGRYAIGFEVVGPSSVAIPTTDYTGCGAGQEAIHNALNKGDGFPGNFLTAPPPQYNPATGAPLRGGKRTRQHGGVGGVDSMAYMAPRAGWTVLPSNAQGGDAGTLADGKTPFTINVPYSAMPTPSPACLKTGGAYKKRKASRKESRKASRKVNRKNSRKASRKASRKSCRKN